MNQVETVVSNAGPLIALGKLGCLDILAALYPVVHLPRAVFDETVTRGLARRAPEAITIQAVCAIHRWPIVHIQQDRLDSLRVRALLGVGERHVLALALTRQPVIVLMDDETARSEARRLGLTVKGTLGILLQAHHVGLLHRQRLELLLETIAERRDIWISPRLCQQVLSQLRE
jgi:predicted nucleic acid-binding protein